MVAARGDSATAARNQLRMSMTGCDGVPWAGFTLAPLLACVGHDADAAKVIDRWLPIASKALIGWGAMMLRAQIVARISDQKTRSCSTVV